MVQHNKIVLETLKNKNYKIEQIKIKNILNNLYQSMLSINVDKILNFSWFIISMSIYVVGTWTWVKVPSPEKFFKPASLIS